MFEVKDQATKEVRAIKDCWIEDHPGEQLEHEVVMGIKKEMDNKNFRKHFIDINGYRKTDTPGGFDSVCGILKNRTLVPRENFEPDFLIPAPDASESTHTTDQDRLRPAPKDLPHPRFRYQVVYDEVGISLFDVTSFADVFKYIDQAAEGM